MSSQDNHVIVSGGFDPIHIGHLNLINEASKLGKVIVIVNSDEFLLEKKGFYLICIQLLQGVCRKEGE